MGELRFKPTYMGYNPTFMGYALRCGQSWFVKPGLPSSEPSIKKVWVVLLMYGKPANLSEHRYCWRRDFRPVEMDNLWRIIECVCYLTRRRIFGPGFGGWWIRRISISMVQKEQPFNSLVIGWQHPMWWWVFDSRRFGWVSNWTGDFWSKAV